MTATRPRTLVLASTSRFRRALLERLGLPFTVAAPGVDETRQPGEPPDALVRRLSEAKARAVAADYPDALVIGSDQVACLDGLVIGKPGGRDGAIEQLTRASGRQVEFLTGLCLLDTATGAATTLIEPFRVQFRTLTPERIQGYLDREQPYDCAGSFRSEALGIALFERLEGADPTALMGLPLIRLIALLEAHGCPPLGA